MQISPAAATPVTVPFQAPVRPGDEVAKFKTGIFSSQRLRAGDQLGPKDGFASLDDAVAALREPTAGRGSAVVVADGERFLAHNLTTVVVTDSHNVGNLVKQGGEPIGFQGNKRTGRKLHGPKTRPLFDVGRREVRMPYDAGMFHERSVTFTHPLAQAIVDGSTVIRNAR